MGPRKRVGVPCRNSQRRIAVRGTRKTAEALLAILLQRRGRRMDPMVEDWARWFSGGGDGVHRHEPCASGRRRPGRQTTVLVLGVLIAFGIYGGAASTEDNPPFGLAPPASPRISVPSVVVAEPASQVRLSIQVDSAESLPSQTYVLIRGLPTGVLLIGGHAIGGGSWAVPLYALRALPLDIPGGSSGRSQLLVSLVTVEGLHLAQASTVLAIGPTAVQPLPTEKAVPAEKTPEPGAANVIPPQPASLPERGLSSPSLAREASAQERALAERLVAQGERYFALGDVVSARLLFRRAADWGSARAALRLAATYDPAELLRLHVQGVTPDRAQARKWYERARELGAPEAQERLSKLGE